ncbi:MerR family transcriptional regulator [Streptomyces sp. ME03-5709C]|nr:MerR family transcriptional regulator [Streptomyces sp. ME03-5709C]
MAELAEAAGVPVRTVRFHRERRLLPAPRREGRIAWYNGRHLARLRTVSALLERGHTLGGIADLTDAWESGRNDVGELLGSDPASPTRWTEEPLRLTPEGLADHCGDQATAENLATALDIGYVAVDGDDVVHVSRRLLEASAALVREGVPLAEVLAAVRAVRARMDLLAELFVELARTHVLPDAQADPRHGDTGPLTEEAIARLRPLVEAVVEAEPALAIDRGLRAEFNR